MWLVDAVFSFAGFSPLSVCHLVLHGVSIVPTGLLEAGLYTLGLPWGTLR